MEICWLKHNELNILLLDFGNFQIADIRKVKPLLDNARIAIHARPKGSVATITDVTNAAFNLETNRMMGDFAQLNKRYVFAAAVVGAVGIRRTIVSTVKIVTSRNIRCFDHRDEAVAWIEKESTRCAQTQAAL